MKIISLLKAVLTEDMNMFKYSSKKNTTKFKDKCVCQKCIDKITTQK